METEKHLKNYLLVAIFSMLFALVGFGYNAWRLEATEDNSNIRAASFQVLIELAELEQIVFLAHYDQDLQTGNPRVGWVKVGIINDLSGLISPAVAMRAEDLHTVWSANWQTMTTSESAVLVITQAIDDVRETVKMALKQLN